MGVPVVTCSGPSLFNRLGAGVLRHIGLGELVAADMEAYVAIAAGLAGDRARLRRFRHRLRERFLRSPSMDPERYTRHLETGYRRIWRRWASGLPAAALDVV
jgi:predicted O-linked N-acetylglucosamine transferase (SPINDLY family)